MGYNAAGKMNKKVLLTIVAMVLMSGAVAQSYGTTANTHSSRKFEGKGTWGIGIGIIQDYF